MRLGGGAGGDRACDRACVSVCGREGDAVLGLRAHVLCVCVRCRSLVPTPYGALTVEVQLMQLFHLLEGGHERGGALSTDAVICCMGTITGRVRWVKHSQTD